MKLIGKHAYLIRSLEKYGRTILLAHFNAPLAELQWKYEI